MSGRIASANPQDLYRYYNRLYRIEGDLNQESSQLESILTHYEARCTERGYLLVVSPRVSVMRGYARDGGVLDLFVREVGRRFDLAGAYGTLEQAYNFVQQNPLYKIIKDNPAAWGWIGILISVKPGILSAVPRIAVPNWLGAILHFFGKSKWWLRTVAHLKSHTTRLGFAKLNPAVIVTTLALIDLAREVPRIRESLLRDLAEPAATATKVGKMIADTLVPITPIVAGWGTGVLAGMAAFSAGAKIGAVVGTVIPGAGTVAGVVVGGIVGVLAYVGTKYIVGSLLEKFHARDRIVEATEKAGQWIGSTVRKGAKAVDDALRPVVQKVASKVGDAIDGASDLAREGLARARAKVDAAMDSTVSAVQRSAENAAKGVGETAKECGLAVTKLVSSATRTVDQVLQPVTKAVSRIYPPAQPSLKQALSDTVSKAASSFSKALQPQPRPKFGGGSFGGAGASGRW